MTDAILRALSMAFAMGWEILWPLILGFALTAATTIDGRRWAIPAGPMPLCNGGLPNIDAA